MLRIATSLLMFAALISCANAASPPPQPATGPGGVAQCYSGVLTTPRTMPSIQQNYWILTPTGWDANCGVAPASLPLVIFMHGYGVETPAKNAGWVNHIVRQGNVVVFPRYHGDCMFCDLFNPGAFTPNAIVSIKDSLSKPWPSGAPTADLARGMMLFGHSAGALVVVNVANRYVANGLPLPTALVLAMPWDNSSMDASLANIPNTVRLLCIVGNTDTNVGRRGCDMVWDRGAQLAQRSYVWMYGDAHGTPALVADHHVPEEASGSNALDWNGLWKFTDAMQTCDLGAVNCDYVIGGGANQTYMGNWSDGVAARPMTATAVKPACPAGSTALGC